MVIRVNCTVNTCIVSFVLAPLFRLGKTGKPDSHEEIICAYRSSERSFEIISALSAFAGNVVVYRGRDG